MKTTGSEKRARLSLFMYERDTSSDYPPQSTDIHRTGVRKNCLTERFSEYEKLKVRRLGVFIRK